MQRTADGQERTQTDECFAVGILVCDACSGGGRRRCRAPSPLDEVADVLDALVRRPAGRRHAPASRSRTAARDSSMRSAARIETAIVTSASGEPISAEWSRHNGTAIIESALVIGHRAEVELTPAAALAASSAGVGELIAIALDGGARRVLVGLGGSTTTDGGLGALLALGARVPFAAGIDVRDLPRTSPRASRTRARLYGAAERSRRLRRSRCPRRAPGRRCLRTAGPLRSRCPDRRRNRRGRRLCPGRSGQRVGGWSAASTSSPSTSASMP